MLKHFVISSILLTMSTCWSLGQVKLKVGDKAPEFSFNDPSGRSIHLSDFKGRIVLLDFWASWCMPCRMANPEMVKMYKQYNKYGFEIFSISLDYKKEAWEKAIKNDSLYWPYHVSDLKGWENEVAELYGVEQVPSTFLLDENGVIIVKDQDAYSIEKKLRYLFLEQVNMYPNMAATKLYFTGKTKYSIEDSLGRVVLKNKGEEVDITGLPVGEYVCKYENKTEKFTKRTSILPKITFYPVNVEDIITLSRNADYEIFDQRGKLKIKGSGESINVQEFPEGVYYLNLEGEIFKIFKK